jgi:hypothetical protein
LLEADLLPLETGLARVIANMEFIG